MAATLSRIVYDQSGIIAMIVHPDDDAHLADVAEFAPAGKAWADVPRASYDLCRSELDILSLSRPFLALSFPAVALLVQARINAINAGQGILG